MKTIILPGFSLHNKDWAEEIKSKIKLAHPIEVIYWEHWKNGGGMKFKTEMEKFMKLIGDGEANIIAKSVGTGVVMKILPLLGSRINKIILCGI